MEPHSLVVGVGSPLQGLDGFGPAVIARLQARTDLPGGTTLLDANTDLLGCLDRFAAFQRVIVVDAFVGGSGDADVAVVPESEIADWSVESPDSHAVSGVLAIGLFRRLYPAAAATTISLVGLNAAGVALGDVIADGTVDAGVDAVIRLLAGGC
jgi:hydrogenase maturation protease